jgi:hypothetical protein
MASPVLGKGTNSDYNLNELEKEKHCFANNKTEKCEVLVNLAVRHSHAGNWTAQRGVKDHQIVKKIGSIISKPPSR